MAGSGTAHMRNNDEVVLEVRDLVVEFKVGGGRVVNAVSKINFDVCRGETLAIVDRAYLIHQGRVLVSGTPSEIVNNPESRRHYLGDGFRL